MRARGAVLVLGLGPLLAGCVDNTAPGNDREAGLEPPARPAETATVGEATRGVAPALLFPQTLTDVDLENVPAGERPCRFHFTAIGLPALAYGSTAVLKVNDRLVALPQAGTGRYAEGPIEVTVRPLEEPDGAGGSFEAELVLRLAGARDELGYHGFSTCTRPET